MKITYDKANVSENEIKSFNKNVMECHKKLHNGGGAGEEFLGWVDLKISDNEIQKIKYIAQRIRDTSDVLIVIGIGGSYLGARAVIDALSHTFFEKKVIFAGNTMSPDYMNDLLDYIKDKEVSLNVISKSGTTTEPAIVFDILKKYMEERYGKDGARNRIYVTTDKEKGVLKKQAKEEGYETFIIPDNIGGRYSVLTTVGLLPIAVCDININKLLEGARDAMKEYSILDDNDCYKYSIIRNILYKKGKKIELLVAYEPKLHYLTEWWKQLFGESEGKDGKGIFPASAIYTTDLHSMGQYVQDGERILFETVIDVENPYRDITLGVADVEEFSFLNGKSLNKINHSAMEGTQVAHYNGKVPNLTISVEKIDEYNIGKLIYFFEKACGISGYLLNVNPFNQPGVESYKKEMFKLIKE